MHGRCDHSVCVDCLWFWLCAARWYKYRQLVRITDSVTCYRRDTSGSGFHSIYRRQHSLCFRSLDQNGTGRHFINRIDTHEIKKEKKPNDSHYTSIKKIMVIDWIVKKWAVRALLFIARQITLHDITWNRTEPYAINAFILNCELNFHLNR